MPLLLVGWALRVVVLLLLAFAEPNLIGVWALFVAYSPTLAVTKAAERLLIGDHADERERGTAYGLYHLMAGLLVLPGALLFGALWERLGSAVAFATAAGATALAGAVLVGLAGTRSSAAR